MLNFVFILAAIHLLVQKIVFIMVVYFFGLDKDF
jgi:hypothetical protein